MLLRLCLQLPCGHDDCHRESRKRSLCILQFTVENTILFNLEHELGHCSVSYDSELMQAVTQSLLC